MADKQPGDPQDPQERRSWRRHLFFVLLFYGLIGLAIIGAIALIASLPTT